MGPKRSSSISNREWVVVVVMAVQLIGMLLFAYGYFTVDDKMLTESEVSDLRLNSLPDETQAQLAGIQIKCSPELSRSTFNKLVFVVIDALRADFIPSITSPSTSLHSQVTMPFLENLICTDSAVAMVSEAQTPTVTMPRIKALMSGTYPSFMDLIYNLNAAKFGDDNFIEQASIHSKRMIFYGDDTWLQMFPSSMFLRSNGTSSFFATDYVQVDTNVTENVIPELDHLNEWDILILHYLGVDHIGHSHGGASSRLLKSKLLEMDDVLRKILESVKTAKNDSYLFVLTGDHGMTDAGNHGGSTTEESNTALVMVNASSHSTSIKPTLSKLPQVKQIDVSITLSTLLGLPIPAKSKGKIIVPAFKAFNVPESKLLCSLNANSLQMQKMTSNKVTSVMEMFIQAVRAHHNYLLGVKTKASAITATKNYIDYVTRIQESIMEGKSHKSIFSILTVGIVLMVGSAAQLIQFESEKFPASILNIINLKDSINLIHICVLFFSTLFLGSTSFIEMESYFWHYMAATLIAINLINSFIKFHGNFHPTSREKFSSSNVQQNGNASSNGHNSMISNPLQFISIRFLSFILILAILRLTSSWSLMNKSDVSDYLSDSQKRHIASCLAILTFVSVTFLFPTSKIGKIHGLLLSGFFWVYLFRCDLGSLAGFRTKILPEVGLDFSFTATMKARLVYLHLIGITIELIMQRLKLDTNWLLLDDFIPKYLEENSSSKRFQAAYRTSALRIFCTSWILFSALLLKVENIPLLGLNVLLEKLLHSSLQGSLRSNRLITFIVTYLTFASSAFYSQGNSNSISTIDVASGYIGLESYNLFLVGFLVASSTYCLYIYWIVMLFIRIDDSKFCSDPKIKYQNLMSSFNFILISRFTSVSFFSIIAFILQNHLFIWSVISPKFMYESCLTILTNLLIFLVFTTHRIDYSTKKNL